MSNTKDPGPSPMELPFAEEVLRAHRVGDRLRFPMPNYIAQAHA